MILRKLKKTLSTASSTTINLPFIATVRGEAKHLEMNVTRAKFEELTHELVERTMWPVTQALAAKKKNKTLDKAQAKETVERSAAGFYRNRENQDFVLL